MQVCSHYSANMTLETPERELETQIPNKNPERFAIVSMYIINVLRRSWSNFPQLYCNVLWHSESDYKDPQLGLCHLLPLPSDGHSERTSPWLESTEGENEWSQAHVHQHPPASKHTFREKKALFSSGQRWREPFQTRLWPGPTETHLPVRSWISRHVQTQGMGGGGSFKLFHQFFMYRRHIKWQPLDSSLAAFPPQNRDSLQINILLLTPALPSSFQT